MPENRVAVYRGSTREEAEREYHRDARDAASAGFVPTSEDWSAALGQQVLTVGYVHMPEQASAVLAALTAAEAETEARSAGPLAPTPPPPPAPPAPVASTAEPAPQHGGASLPRSRASWRSGW